MVPFLLLLAVPAGEIVVFIEVGDIVGTWPTIGAILGTAFAGGALLRRQGLRTLALARRQLAAHRSPAAELVECAGLALSAVLLLLPGFFTDALGIALLFPPLRRALLRTVLARVAAGARRGPVRRRPARSGGGTTVIDGEYSVLDEGDEARAAAARHDLGAAPQGDGR